MHLQDLRKEPRRTSIALKPAPTQLERACYWICTISLCVLALVAIASCFLQNDDGDTLADVASGFVQDAKSDTYINMHKGEKSAMAQASEKGLDFDYGVSIVTVSDNPDVDSQLVAYANKILGYVPDYIKVMFEDDGWKVLLSNEDLGTRFEDPQKGFEPGKLRGLTSFDEHVIYIDGNAYSIESAMLHEMGHYMDAKLGRPSSTDEFAQALEEDRDPFDFYVKKSADESSEEMFADAFAAYCYQPVEMEMHCSNLYSLFQELM